MDGHIIFMDWKIGIGKFPALSKLTYTFNAISIKIQKNFIKTDKQTQKLIWKCKGSRLSKIIFKNKMGKLTSKYQDWF